METKTYNCADTDQTVALDHMFVVGLLIVVDIPPEQVLDRRVSVTEEFPEVLDYRAIVEAESLDCLDRMKIVAE